MLFFWSSVLLSTVVFFYFGKWLGRWFYGQLEIVEESRREAAQWLLTEQRVVVYRHPLRLVKPLEGEVEGE